MSEAVFAACACGAGEGDVSAGDRLAAAAAGTGSLPDGQVSGQWRRGEVSGNTAQGSAQWRLARDAAAVACAMTSHVLPRAASLRLTVTAHARGLWLHLAYCQPGPPAGSPWSAAAAGRLALIDATARRWGCYGNIASGSRTLWALLCHRLTPALLAAGPADVAREYGTRTRPQAVISLPAHGRRARVEVAAAVRSASHRHAVRLAVTELRGLQP